MKCKVPGRHIRMLGRAIHSLARVGEDLYIDPQSDGVGFRTINSSRSAFISFLFYERFFDEYIEKCPEILNRSLDSNTSMASQYSAKCRISMKAILIPFRSINVLDKTVEACSIRCLPHQEKVQVEFECKYGIRKRYTIPFIESEALTSDVDMAQSKNNFTCHAKVLNDAALNFLKAQEEITMMSSPDCFHIKTFLETDDQDVKDVRTEYMVPPGEFEAFAVETSTAVTYCLKELRALISFADAFTLPLSSSYGNGGEPIVFSVESPEIVKAGLVMATLEAEFNPETKEARKQRRHEKELKKVIIKLVKSHIVEKQKITFFTWKKIREINNSVFIIHQSI